MKHLFSLLIVCLFCGCDPLNLGEPLDDGTQHSWFIKNNTTHQDLHVSYSLFKDKEIPAGDSICIYVVNRHYALSCDCLFTHLYDRQGEAPTFSITDSDDTVLKQWQISESGNEPHHFFAVQSWRRYEKPHYKQIIWVFTVVEDDLNKE